MHRVPRRFAASSAMLLGLIALPAAAVDWTSWTAASAGQASGQLLDGTSTVALSYSGELAFAQLNGVGTNYFLPLSTFTAPGVATAPVVDMLAITGNSTLHTISFSQAVVDPLLAVVSLGQPSVGTQYIFNLGAGQSMSILNQGPSNAFAGCATCLSLQGSTLTGNEGDGLVQFKGTFRSLSWTGANPENWNGITIGIGAVAPVPEPATWLMLSLGLLGLLPLARRRCANPAHP